MQALVALWSRSRRVALIILGVFCAAATGAFAASSWLLQRLTALLRGVAVFQSFVGEALAARLLLCFACALAAAAFAGLCVALRRFLPRQAAALCACALGLFACGLAFGLFGILPPSLALLTGMLSDRFTLHLTLYGYTMFCTLFLLLTGLLFELPLALLLFWRIGIVAPTQLRRNRARALLGALVIMAVLTPTHDAVTLVMTMLPLMLLYEISLQWLRLLERRRDGKRRTGPGSPG